MKTARVHHATWRRGGWRGRWRQRAQQDGRIRRVIGLDRWKQRRSRSQQPRCELFADGPCARLGWIDGRNVKIDIRFPDGQRRRRNAAPTPPNLPRSIRT